MPAPLRELLKRTAHGCREELEKLYCSCRFTEDQLDAFLVNNDNKLTAESVPVFKAFLDEEIQKSAPQATATPAKAGAGAVGKKRKVGALGLPTGIGAALGLAGADTPRPAAEAAADAKRPREGAPEASVEATPGLAPTTSEPALEMEVLGDSSLWTGRSGEAYHWMDEALEERLAAQDKRLLRLQEQLVQAMRRRHPDDEDIVVGTIGVISNAEVMLCGRIVCESLEGKLNERSLLLEAPAAGGRPPTRVRLNAGGCASIVAFPGQLVCVLGRCGVNSVFHARDMTPGLALPEPRSIAPVELSGDASLFVLSGPFCLRNGLDYSPLERAIERVAAARPRALLLLGPLLDSANQCVASGVAGADEADSPDSFEDVYADTVLPLLHRSLLALRRASPGTQVLLVPSLEDVLCFHPLPQPPLDAMLRPALGPRPLEQLRGVRFLPNPAHVRLGGLSLSVTSADALSPLIRAGLVQRPEGGRLEAGMRALLEQRCLFPVLPRDPAQVAEKRAAALDFPGDAVPDVCIFPSQAGTSGVTHVQGTAFVNPGTVCRPAALGTFVELRWRAGRSGLLRDVLEAQVHKL